MKTKDKIENVIKECQKLSFETKASFPEVIKKLIEVGIERYYADLVRLEKTYYTEGTESYPEKLPLSDSKGIEEVFCEEGVRSAIKDTQLGEIDYTTFLHRIMKSGVVNYSVFIKGKQVHYIGRKGEIWVEHFPRK